MPNYKKLLTIEQLLEFCEQQKFQHFSSKESGYQLAVRVPTTFEEVKDIDENHRGMMKLKFKIFHTGLNRNGSFVSETAAKKAMKTIADRPVLAAIHQLDDGSWDFEGHEMEIIENENGESEVRYIESQVGSFSSEPAFWEHDDELDKDFVCAYAYISREYTKAAEIIENKNGTKNSCELFIDELSYNAKEKYLDLTEFFVNASTLLGRRDDGTEIGEGMLGSRADIEAFSVDNNSIKYQQDEKLIKIMQELKESLDNYTSVYSDQNLKEGGKPVKFEELLEKYGKTAEDVTFDYENMSDEELEVAFAEAFAEDEGDEGNTAEEAPASENPDADPEPTEDENVEEGEISTENESVNDPESEPEAEDEFALKFAVSGKEISKEFSISLNDKLYAMWSLVNETYGELDDDYYDVDVYEDDKIVEMHSYWTNKHYRQSFKTKKDTYQLVGDRVEIFAKYLTQDEITALDNMKSEYSILEDKVAKYEAEPEKIELLHSEAYSQIADSEEFKKLMEKDVYFDMSIKELAEKADAILLDFAKNNKLEFSAQPEKKQFGLQHTITGKKKTSRYGNLFSKE